VTLSPPGWFLAGLVAMEALGFLARGSTWIERPWTLLGLVPIAAGVAVHARASATFRGAGTTIEPEGKPTRLVRSGPYARTRNPMYLAGVPILAGAAILLGAATPWIVVGLYLAIAPRWVAREEGALRARFGTDWDAYRGAVRRWL
jgi:protein-S-isoprenylcysteine O-methyltransferase Ste14